MKAVVKISQNPSFVVFGNVRLRDDEPPGAERAPEHTYLGMVKKDMQVMIEALGGDPKIFDALVVTDTYGS